MERYGKETFLRILGMERPPRIDME